MGRLGALALAAVIASTLPVTGPAWAGEGHEKAKRLKNAGQIMPLESVIDVATSQKPGRVIEAELKKSDGGYIYEIELVDKFGVVWELNYDAKTGELVSSKEED